MKENKIFKVLRALNKEEFPRFIDFVNSPYFNKRRDLVLLAGFLYPGYPDFSPEFSDNKKIYKAVYGEKDYNEQVVKNLLSRANDLLDEFLIQSGLSSDGFTKTSLLVNQLAVRGKAKSAERIIDEDISRLDKSEDYAIEYLKKIYDYLEIKNDLMNYSTFSYKGKIHNSKLRGESAVNYFLLALLRIANEYAVFNYVQIDMEKEKLYNNFFSYFDFEKYLEKLRETGSPLYAVMAINYHGLLSKIDDPLELHREKLKQVAFENLDSLRDKDKYESWVLIFASYIFSNTPQKGNVSVELHKVNKFFVEAGIMQKDEQGYIIKTNYHNIAMQAITAGEFEWARKFLEENKSKLPPNSREDAYMLCIGTYYFNTKQYEKCIKAYSKVNIDNVLTNVMVRASYIKCYYELGYYDEAASAIEALNDFVTKNQELTAQVRRPLPAFVRYARLLLRTKSLNKKLPAEHYLRAKKIEGFHSKTWVIEKMEELL